MKYQNFGDWFKESDHRIHLMYWCEGKEDPFWVEKLPFEWAWGIYQEYALEEYGMHFEIFRDKDGTFGYLISIFNERGELYLSPVKGFETMIEAKKESLNHLKKRQFPSPEKQRNE